MPKEVFDAMSSAESGLRSTLSPRGATGPREEETARFVAGFFAAFFTFFETEDLPLFFFMGRLVLTCIKAQVSLLRGLAASV